MEVGAIQEFIREKGQRSAYLVILQCLSSFKGGHKCNQIYKRKLEQSYLMVFIILKKESNIFPSVTGSGEYFHAIAEYLFLFLKCSRI